MHDPNIYLIWSPCGASSVYRSYYEDSLPLNVSHGSNQSNQRLGDITALNSFHKYRMEWRFISDSFYHMLNSHKCKIKRIYHVDEMWIGIGFPILTSSTWLIIYLAYYLHKPTLIRCFWSAKHLTYLRRSQMPLDVTEWRHHNLCTCAFKN